MKRSDREKTRNNRRKLVTILWITLMIIALAAGMAGCSSGESEQAADETTAAATTEQVAESAENQENADAAKTETKAASDAEATKAATQAVDQTEKKSTEAKKSEVSKKQTKAEETKATKNKKKSSKTKKNSAKGTTKATQANVCHITVEGYCSSKTVSLRGGDTAYSVLKRSGANVSAENSSYGVYVKGINGRFEFDEGPSSGWMFSINGTPPNKAADKCSVGKGDTVKWYYVK